uniref:AP_endonuc_2 domain-containing protein n=1 Tax=Ganoderma boninense TaxID=34458 RepID=A0A5K1JXB6_9APHY|nr:AP_endonuc_2 domain-containing protein [Ganoderma boninense]
MAQLLVLAFAVLTIAYCGNAFNPPIVPLGWTTVYPCVVDNATSRVITNSVGASYTDNTPASCIDRCDTANYTYAGVEYSNECFCGTGLISTLQAAPPTDCNMTCAGDASLSCGASLRIQVGSLSYVDISAASAFSRRDINRSTSPLRSLQAHAPRKAASSTHRPPLMPAFST